MISCLSRNAFSQNSINTCQHGLKDYPNRRIIIGPASGINPVAELSDKALAGVVVELGSHSEKGDKGIDCARKGGGTDPMPVLHVATIACYTDQYISSTGPLPKMLPPNC